MRNAAVSDWTNDPATRGAACEYIDNIHRTGAAVGTRPSDASANKFKVSRAGRSAGVGKSGAGSGVRDSDRIDRIDLHYRPGSGISGLFGERRGIKEGILRSPQSLRIV